MTHGGSVGKQQVLGVDPGIVTGYGLLEFEARAVRLLDYGIIAIPSGETPQQAVWRWFIRFHAQRRLEHVGIEALLQFKGPDRADFCPAEAKAVQSAIELFLTEQRIPFRCYHPATVKSALGGQKTKVGVRRIVSAMVGSGLSGLPTHVSDAIAAGLVYAQRELGWVPVLSPQVCSAKPRKRRPTEPEDLTLTDPETVTKLMRQGRLRVPRVRRFRADK